MRKKNICLSLGLSALLASSLTGCVTINVQSDSPVGEAVLDNLGKTVLASQEVVVTDNLVESQDSYMVEDVANVDSSMENVEDSNHSVVEGVENLDSSVEELKPLSFIDYESSLKNSDGYLFFVNESEFSEVLKPLFDAYSTSSQYSGVVTISEGNEITESFAFQSDTAWSVIKDKSYLINEFKDGSWETIEYLDKSDSKNNLLCSSKYDSGFDFLLSSDKVVFEFVDCKSLGLGEYLFVCNYAYGNGDRGVIEFKVCSDGLLTYIKKSPISVDNELNISSIVEYRIVYSSSNDGSYNDGLLTYYNLISSVHNSAINVSESYSALKNKSVGGFNILNRDVFVDASNLLINAYKKSSSLDFCMEYYKYSDTNSVETPDGELLSQVLGYSSDNSYWYHKIGENLSIISLEEDADGNKSWLGSQYNHNGDTIDVSLSSSYDSVLDSILKTDEYTFIITSMEENVSKEIQGKEDELLTLVHVNYLFNGISGPMDIYINGDGTLYSTSMLYENNLYISIFNNINDFSYSELKSNIITNSFSIENKDLNSLKKILNQVK